MYDVGTWTGNLGSGQVYVVSYPLGLWGEVRNGEQMTPIYLN